MRLRPRQGLLLGLAILAAGSVVLEIALARTLGALVGPHAAPAVHTLALAGAALGGAMLAALPGLVRRPALLSRASLLSGAAAAASLAAILVIVHVKVPDVLDRAAVGPAALVYAAAVLPFFFVGLAVAAAVRHVPVLGGRVVFALFTGVAVGAPLALGALRAGAPRAALIAAVVYAFASLLFYLGARSADARVERPRGAMVATFVLAAAVVIAGDLGAPWLKLPSQRFSPLDKTEAQEWSVLGLASVERAAANINWIHTDGTAAIPIVDGKTPVSPGPDEIVYQLHRDQGPIAILGGAGGREARIALKYGAKQIDAIDLDPVVLRAFMLDRYKKASGDVYDSGQVRSALDDGRGFVRRAPAPYRSIVVAFQDATTAHAAGALAADPADLLTVEAFGDLIARLTPEGTLAVTRMEVEIDRLVILAATALRNAGAADPAQHLYGCSYARTTTLVVRKSPLASQDTTLLRAYCRRNKMIEVLAPDVPNGEVRRRLTADMTRLAPSDPAARTQMVAAGPPHAWDLRAPTGDRPFFAAVVPPASWRQALGDKAAGTTAQALLVLGGVAALAALLLFFSIGLPLAAQPRWPVGRLRPLVFFFAMGGALAFAFVGLVPRMEVALGHPLYTYTTVVPVLMSALGLGGLRTILARARGDSLPRAIEDRAGIRAELLAVVLAAAAVGLGPGVDLALGLPFGARVAVVVAFLLPVGVLAGAVLALGIRQVGLVSAPLGPWCWGMAGAGALVAVALGLPGTLALGYSAAVLAAGACVLLAAITVPRPPR